MKVIVTLRAEKAPKDDEEKAILAEIQANGKLEEWRREAEETLRAHMRSELDDPDVLDVSVTIVEDPASCRMCDGTKRTARYGRKEKGEPQIVRGDCPNCCPGSCEQAAREERPE